MKVLLMLLFLFVTNFIVMANEIYPEVEITDSYSDISIVSQGNTYICYKKFVLKNNSENTYWLSFVNKEIMTLDSIYQECFAPQYNRYRIATDPNACRSETNLFNDLIKVLLRQETFNIIVYEQLNNVEDNIKIEQLRNMSITDILCRIVLFEEKEIYSYKKLSPLLKGIGYDNKIILLSDKK